MTENELSEAFSRGLDLAAGADLSFISKSGHDYAKNMHDESVRLKTIAREMNEEVPKVTLNCKICGAEIDAHYGEVSLTIQPHVIQDGSFWKIDQYNPDIYKQDIVCEPCIIELRDKIQGHVPLVVYTFTEILGFVRTSIREKYLYAKMRVRAKINRIAVKTIGRAIL